jgi:hypothetical protein
MGGHLTGPKIWVFAMSEEGKNIKNTCKKARDIVSHNKLKTVFIFKRKIYKN